MHKWLVLYNVGSTNGVIMQIQTIPCSMGEIIPLSTGELAGISSHIIFENPMPILKVGTKLTASNQVIFKVVGRSLLPSKNSPHAQMCPLLKSYVPLKKNKLELDKSRHGYALAWITLSDKGFIGQREDESGPCVSKTLNGIMTLCHDQGFMLLDESKDIQTLLLELAVGQGYDLICTTGGTGLGPRDVTVEATLAVLEKRLHGFEQLMMQTSLSKTHHAIISRAVAGTIGQCLCINLPGSKKAVQENLGVLLKALPHALAKLQGDSTDCAEIN